MMKRTGLVLALTVAIGNVVATLILWRVSLLMRDALNVPLEENPPSTVFFVRCWWWPALITGTVLLALTCQRFRKPDRGILILTAVLLLAEAAILVIAILALVVPLAMH